MLKYVGILLLLSSCSSYYIIKDKQEAFHGECVYVALQPHFHQKGYMLFAKCEKYQLGDTLFDTRKMIK